MHMINISRIDLNLFTVLDAIYTEGGVSRAALKLNLTQPAVSHALGRLRLLFEDPLFVRQGQALVPTPLTRSVIEPVREALRRLTVTLVEAGQFDPASATKRFTIAMRDILESIVLPPMLRRIGNQAPGLEFSAARFDRRQIESSLASGAVDAAMDILLPLPGAIKRQRVESERLVVVARRDHPEVGPGLDLDTYLRQHHVLISSRRRGAGGLEDFELGRLGLKRNIRLRCQHYFAACRVASQTDLLVTMAERYAMLVNPAYGNQILPLPFETPTLDLYLYWHQAVDQDPANRWLRAQIIAAFEG